MVDIDGDTYVFDENGYMIHDSWYYRPQTGDPSLYYFKSSGAMAYSEWIHSKNWVSYFGRKETNSWVDNGRYYVDNNGNWDPSKGTRSTYWDQNSYGWWFNTGDGSYALDFYEVNKKMYYFGSDGYMRTGWEKINNVWYYFGDDGAMRVSQWAGDYYLSSTGAMAVSTWIDGKYWVDANGKWDPNKKVPESIGWHQNSKGWYYSTGNGSYLTDGEYRINNRNYYFDSDGYLYMGWFRIGSIWHYSDPVSGEIYKNRWSGNYWLDSNGCMAVNQWVDGGKYYVGPDGAWIPGYGS